MITRRAFFKRSGLFALSFGVVPELLSRKLFAAIPAQGNEILIVIFQRGAMDGLSMVPPIGDPEYFAGRPNIALKTMDERPPLTLDGYFALHPSLEPIKKYWDEGSLAFIHQVGSPNNTRSHFDAQDFMETGTPGEKNTQDGFLNRALAITPGYSHSPLRAVALQPNMPRMLWGKFPALSMNSIHDFKIRDGASSDSDELSFEKMYQEAADRVFRGVGEETFDAIKEMHAAAPDKTNDKSERYPKAPIGKRLAEIAELIKARRGLQLAVTDMGGWDTHVNQGNHKGQLSDRFSELSKAIAAFREDIGSLYQNVTLVTLTEFGRTVKENGNRGTDHGHGSVMMVMGGSVYGKKVYGDWKELKSENLYEGRDMPVTTDFRDVFAEILFKKWRVPSLEPVFPKFEALESHRVRFLKA